MGRTARDRRDLPHPRPVEKIQLSEDNPAKRFIAAGLFLLLGACALAYAFSRLLTPDAGWQAIQAGTSQGTTCGEEFVFLYELGASGQPTASESRDLTAKYTEAARKAFQLFHTMEGFEGVVNLYEINRRPNEVLEVDEVLYRAFAAVQEYGDRTIYLGPVYARYSDLFYCEDDAQLIDFDPYLSDEVREEYAAIAAYAQDPRHIDVEVLEDNQIRLRVSEEYLAYARREGIDCFLDFGWMRNAFITDYFAQVMIENGYTYGSITSFDGFARCLDGREGRYALSLLDQLEDQPIQVGTMEYQGPMSMVSLRTFPAAAGDEQRYYRLRNGEIRTLYLDPKDGLCKSAADSMVFYSQTYSCAQLALETAPVYIADMLESISVQELNDKGIQFVLCRDERLYTSDPEVEVTNLREGYTVLPT